MMLMHTHLLVLHRRQRGGDAAHVRKHHHLRRAEDAVQVAVVPELHGDGHVLLQEHRVAEALQVQRQLQTADVAERVVTGDLRINSVECANGDDHAAAVATQALRDFRLGARIIVFLCCNVVAVLQHKGHGVLRIHF